MIRLIWFMLGLTISGAGLYCLMAYQLSNTKYSTIGVIIGYLAMVVGLLIAALGEDSIEILDIIISTLMSE